MGTDCGLMTRSTSTMFATTSLEVIHQSEKDTTEKGQHELLKEMVTSSSLRTVHRQFLEELTSNRADHLAASMPRSYGPGSSPLALGRIHKISRRDTRRRVRARCVEGVLYRLLKRLPPETRLAVISHRFSQKQRLALERWIVSQRASPAHLRTEEPRFVWHAPSGAPVAKARGKALSESKRNASKKRSILDSTGFLPAGVSRRVSGGHICYAVDLAAGPFRLFTKSTHDLSEALRRHSVLSFFRLCYLSAMPTNLSHSAEDVERAFRQAVSEALSHYGVQLLRKVAIRFAATIPAKLWVGRSLSTPRYEIINSRSVDIGLHAWRRLTQCRGLVHCGQMNRYTLLARHNPNQLMTAWNHMKRVYMDIWTHAGRSRKSIESQLAELEACRCQFHYRLRDRWLLLCLRRDRQATQTSAVECCTSSSSTLKLKRTPLNPYCDTQCYKKQNIASQFSPTSACGEAIELSAAPSEHASVLSAVAKLVAPEKKPFVNHNENMSALSSTVYPPNVTNTVPAMACLQFAALGLNEFDIASTSSSDACEIKCEPAPQAHDASKRVLQSCRFFVGIAGCTTVKKIESLLSRWTHCRIRSSRGGLRPTL